MLYKQGRLALLIITLAAVLTACGGPKADISIFMMFSRETPFYDREAIQNQLGKQLGESPTAEVSVTPYYDPQKMFVEIAAGDWGIYVLPKEQFDQAKQEGGFVPLDDILNKEDYPDGVYDGKLVGVPLKDSRLLKEAGYKGNEVYGLIIVRAKKQELAKQVLKVMAERDPAK